MNILTTEPYKYCECKICGIYGTLEKNIGNYCYNCLKSYKIVYPEYIKLEQHYMYLKQTLENKFDNQNNT